MNQMNRRELDEDVTPEALADYATREAAAVQQAEQVHGGPSAPMETVREDTYHGHHIVIRTSYRIEVDGRSIEGHLGVTNDGQVHYHAIPNLSFASAVDLVKLLIDTFPDEFSRKP